MITYEIHIRDSAGNWVKIPDGLTHRKLAKAKEELQEKKQQYPGAFVAAVEYGTGGDPYTARMVLGPFTPVPFP